MADDNSARYRSNDAFGRGPAAPASDPLAELARLIGRNDPFSEYGKDARPAVPQPTPQPGARYDVSLPVPPFHNEPAQPPYAAEPAPRYSPEPAQHYSPDPAPPSYGHETAPRYASEYPPCVYDDPAGHNDWPVPAPPRAPAHPSNDRFALPQQPPYVPQPSPRQIGRASC